jgi:hypothetical protein
LPITRDGLGVLPGKYRGIAGKVYALQSIAVICQIP